MRFVVRKETVFDEVTPLMDFENNKQLWVQRYR